MNKPPKRFEPKSRWVKYRDQRWIPNRKRIYLYWFKYLQHAERHPTKKVDWSKYKGWGGANRILGQKFDIWWESNWKELFSVEKEGNTPKFSISTNRPKPDGMRYALLVYENLHRGTNWDIAIHIQKKEQAKRYGVQSFFFASKDVESGVVERQDIQSKVGKYERTANKYLDNVCIGQFP